MSGEVEEANSLTRNFNRALTKASDGNGNAGKTFTDETTGITVGSS
jgi:hypothetical protein